MGVLACLGCQWDQQRGVVILHVKQRVWPCLNPGCIFVSMTTGGTCAGRGLSPRVLSLCSVW